MILRNIFLSLAILTSPFLQSCTVGYYKIRDEIVSNKTPNFKECDIKYSVSLGDGYKSYQKETLEEIRKNHIILSKEVFDEYGCNSKLVENKSDSNFLIEIQKPPFLGASGLDYLNVFLFGLIPTTETREYQIYNFYNLKSNAKHTYHIDYKNYNHLIFLPFFWTAIFTVDEGKVFKKSLRNFIENS